ncbi:hypothetical protein KKH27_07785 [bacterium]|nr:hypothetical protein [bacterium]MBU1984275.1 hypothetical protein [bacterium]
MHKSKINCWQFKRCGRQPGGSKAAEFGVCPAFIETRTHTINGGVNGGRACWAIAGTLCAGKVQGTFALKIGDCTACSFYVLVTLEESTTYVTGREILALLTSTNPSDSVRDDICD